MGAPFAKLAAATPSPSSAPASKSAAVDPVATPVAPEGILLRRAPAGWVECPASPAFTSAVALLDVPASSKGWLLPNNMWIQSANESAPSCAKPPAGVPPQPARAPTPINLAPGRYRIGFFSASQYGGKWSTPTTFGLYPPDPSPLLHAEIPATVPVKERVLELWYPFLWPHDPQGNFAKDPAAIKALESVPRQLFVYATANSRSEIEQLFHDGSDDTDKPPRSPGLTANEPLLRLWKDWSVYLATDLSRLSQCNDDSLVAEPTGPVVLPTPARAGWAPLKKILKTPPSSKEKEVAAFVKLADFNARCMDAARHYNSHWSDGLTVVTAAMRDAAQARWRRALVQCKDEEFRAKRAKLRTELQAAYAADWQSKVDALRPRLKTLFSVP